LSPPPSLVQAWADGFEPDDVPKGERDLDPSHGRVSGKAGAVHWATAGMGRLGCVPAERPGMSRVSPDLDMEKTQPDRSFRLP
jgi:hypothetical protein